MIEDMNPLNFAGLLRASLAQRIHLRHLAIPPDEYEDGISFIRKANVIAGAVPSRTVISRGSSSPELGRGN